MADEHRSAVVSRRLLSLGAYLSGLGALAINAGVTWPLLARVTDEQRLGSFATSLAAVAMLAPLVTAGLHAILVRDAASRLPGVAGTAVQTARDSVLVIFVVGSVAAFGIGRRAPVLGGMVFATAGMGVGFIAMAVARGLDQARTFVWLTLFTQSLTLGGAALVLANGAPLYQSMAVYGLLALAPSLLHLRIGPLRRSLSERRSALRHSLRLSVPLLPHLLMMATYLHGARLLVAAIHGLSAAAHYQFASILGGLLLTGASVLNSHWSTVAYRNVGLDDFVAACERYIRHLLVIVAGGALLLAAAAPLVIPAWVPPSYPIKEVVAAVMAFLPAGAFQVLGDVHSTIALRHNRVLPISMATLLGAIVMVASYPAWSAALGPVVAGGAAVSGGFLARGAALVVFLRRSGLPIVVPRMVWLSSALGILAAVAGLRIAA